MLLLLLAAAAASAPSAVVQRTQNRPCWYGSFACGLRLLALIMQPAVYLISCMGKLLLDRIGQ
jgi:hypothetical protein